MAQRESKAERENREEQDNFKESNWKIAKAISLQWDDLLDDLHEIAENCGIDNDRMFRIGWWDRISRLCRLEDGIDYLNDSDRELLREEGKFYDKGEVIFRDDIATTLSASQIANMKEWHAASYRERMVAFGLYAWMRVSSGEADEGESVFLFGLANRLMGYLDFPDDSGQRDKEKVVSFSELGKAGAKKRHKPMKALREWAIEKYQAGDWSSANQAAYELQERVITHGLTIGATLAPTNAQRTIAEWFRKSV